MPQLEDPVFVIAVLGRTPAVITELVWHLVVQEGATIVGLEIWTTAGPPNAPQKHLLQTSEALGRLRTELTGALPPPPDPQLVRDPPAWDAAPAARFVGVERPNGPFLRDVADQADATLIDAALYQRVRDLRRSLPPTVQLIGSLAGGRKTMSTALHTAFELQSRLQDRLVHVFPSPEVDAVFVRDPSERGEYLWPTTAMAELSGASVDEQVVVVDVPFPLVRWRVSPKLAESLDTLSYADFWAEFRKRSSHTEEATAVLTRDTSQPFAQWRFTIAWSDDDQRHVYLTLGQACVLRALADEREGLTPESLRDRVCEIQDAEQMSFDDQQVIKVKSAEKRLRRLGLKLDQHHVPRHLRPVHDEARGVYVIPGAVRIHVER